MHRVGRRPETVSKKKSDFFLIKGSNLLLALATSKYVLYNSTYVTSIEIGSIVDRVKKQMLKDKQFINKMVEIKKRTNG